MRERLYGADVISTRTRKMLFPSVELIERIESTSPLVRSSYHNRRVLALASPEAGTRPVDVCHVLDRALSNVPLHELFDVRGFVRRLARVRRYQVPCPASKSSSRG